MPPKKTQSIDAYVAGRLRGMRLQLGISQAQLARQLGVTFQQVQKYEAGINRVGAGRLFQLAALYGISIQEFFPKTAVTSEGRRTSEKLDQIARFASSAEGSELCETFQRIKSPRRRKLILSLLREMSGG
jgi:transcriptional regulator with XRE-family HTH domain